ncbi:hypothetical protein Tco_0883341 [Tanacetum coccineum]
MEMLRIAKVSCGGIRLVDKGEKKGEQCLGVFWRVVRTGQLREMYTVMYSASYAVTYTSIYTDSELGRVFWEADEEVSDGGSPLVIVLGYDGLPIQPVVLPSPDYIPDSEEPRTPRVPQDEDEHEPMCRIPLTLHFIQSITNRTKKMRKRVELFRERN